MTLRWCLVPTAACPGCVRCAKPSSATTPPPTSPWSEALAIPEWIQDTDRYRQMQKLLILNCV